MSNVKKQAQGIAALGRGGDSVAVHMSPQEVQGLQHLALQHGGSLSINPKTGMVEANFLSSILPTIVGAGMMMVPGMQPWGAALAGGAMGALTGDKKRGLLMNAGLGALGGYGGAGMYNSIAGMGAGAAAGTEGALGSASAVNALTAPSPLAADPLGTFANAAQPTGVVGESLWGQLPPGAGSAAEQATLYNGFEPPYSTAMAPAATPVNPLAADQAVQTVTSQPEWGASIPLKPEPDFMRGLGSLKDSPSQILKTGTEWDKEKMKNAAMAAAPMLAYAMEPNTLPGGLGANNSSNPGTIRPYDYSQTRNPNWGQPGQPYFLQSYSAGTPYAAAAGGQVPGMAQGGVSSLGHYSDGGRLLRGPGTGLSDDIPACINDKQPAKLAGGEFVISSDVVSDLGGGSTESGAKKLYAMMDRVRKQAHGTKKQIKPVNDKRVMPA